MGQQNIRHLHEDPSVFHVGSYMCGLTINREHCYVSMAALSIFVILLTRGPGSVVGIATGYGLDGPGIESRRGREFPHLSRLALGPPILLYNGYRVFLGGKEGPGLDADLSTPSSAVVEKRVQLYLYSILWAVRPVQSLTACTTVHYIVDSNMCVVSIQGTRCYVSVCANFAYLVSSSDLHVCTMANIFTIDVKNMTARHSILGHTRYTALHLLLFHITRCIPLFLFCPVKMPREFIEFSWCI